MPSLQPSRVFLRLTRHHLWLFLLNATAITALYFTRPGHDAITRASFATAYPALLLVGWTLVLGPWRLWRTSRIPVSFDLRRDVGIWAGFLSILHTVLGQMVHLRGRPWLYYVYPSHSHHTVPLRHDLFGVANGTGLVAALVITALLATSNDAALRLLGTPRWKRLQRWSYAAFALAGLHTLLYLRIEKQMISGWALLAALCLAITATVQISGYALRRRLVQPRPQTA